jgi:hypothetical protein
LGSSQPALQRYPHHAQPCLRLPLRPIPVACRG